MSKKQWLPTDRTRPYRFIGQIAALALADGLGLVEFNDVTVQRQRAAPLLGLPKALRYSGRYQTQDLELILF